MDSRSGERGSAQRRFFTAWSGGSESAEVHGRTMMGASAHPIVTGAALSRARGRLAFWRTRLRPTAIFHSMGRRIRIRRCPWGADDSARPHISSSLHGLGRNMEKGFETPFFPQPPQRAFKALLPIAAPLSKMEPSAKFSRSPLSQAFPARRFPRRPHQPPGQCRGSSRPQRRRPCGAR